ncbi:hypothetical protein EDB89DRAFT_1447794 [Lactarius sanguifluus]|nr:hypothetical protein EDB89DRAFT_1447794 [Lactarius sanguifluus]
MPRKSEPPSFPQPFDFDSAEISNPGKNVAGSYEQRSLGPAQDYVYPSESQSPGGAINLMPASHAPLPAYTPAHQPIQISGRTHPDFPMLPSQGTSVPAIPSFPQQPMAQRNEAMYLPGYPNNTQLAPRPYSSYSSQAPVVSHSLSQRGPGTMEPAYTTPCVQKNQDDSDDERYEVDQGIPARYDGNLRPKSPPKRPVDTVPITVRYRPCARAGCQQLCPERYEFCSAECANPPNPWRR